ncbi:MAG: hypothetical protein JJ916_07695 [Phycisphaerales bacterium]|nr:hypothetical protein [Phycisphaerales bacterium]
MRTRSASIRAMLLASVSAGLCGYAHTCFAQDELNKRPAGSGRIVKAFSFEERDLNPLPVPLGWIRAQDDPAVPRDRPGFPIWNGAVLDYNAPAYDGIGSVKLPTNGGSTSLMLRHGELSIFPNADYLISAQVRTAGLEHAHARIVATFLDQRGEPIESSRTVSDLVQSETDWQKLTIEMEGIEQHAAFMQLELQLLQPEQQDRKDQLPFQVWEQDFDGAVWFDNLIIAQLPRLEISTGSPGNVVESETAPALQVLVRDLTGDRIHAQMRIYDVHDNLIDQRVVSEGTKSVRIETVPDLPGFGWYRAMLEVFVDRRLVGLRTLDFIWAPPTTNLRGSGMFSVDTTMTDRRMLDATPLLIQGAGVDRASVRVWDHTTLASSINDDSPLFQTLEHLLREGIDLSFELAELPAPLATQIASDPQEVLHAFEDPNGDWTKWGSLMLDRFGQRVTTWCFGSLPSEEPPGPLYESLAQARVAISGFVPGPTASVAWPIDRPLPSELAMPGMQIELIDDHSVSPDAIEQLVSQWKSERVLSDGSDTPSPKLALRLSPLEHPSERSGMQTWSALGSLARKAISFWWAAKEGGENDYDYTLSLSDAWWVAPGKRGQVMPASELIVWRTLANHLGGRDAIESLDLIPGVRMLVISGYVVEDSGQAQPSDKPSGGLVLWLEEPTLDPVELSMPLALTPVRVFDVLSNSTTVHPIEVGNIGVPTHTIRITRSPIIVEGINPELVRFLSSLRISPDELISQSGLHQHDLMIRNPWDIPISGRVFVVEPGGFTGDPEHIDRSWEIIPRVVPFTLGAGEERAFPLNIGYSLGELAGEKQLVFDVELDADRNYPTLRVQRTIELGLPDIEMVVTAQRNDAGVTVVTASVSHTDTQDQYFELIAIAPNEPRIRRSINALPPGQAAVRQFAFTQAVPGDQVVVVLIPRDNSKRLNEAVVVP